MIEMLRSNNIGRVALCFSVRLSKEETTSFKRVSSLEDIKSLSLNQLSGCSICITLSIGLGKSSDS